MHRAFWLEAATGKRDVLASVLELGGLKNLAALGVANMPQIGDLINAVRPSDVAPLLGHAPLLLGGNPQKGIPRTLSVGITDLQVPDKLRVWRRRRDSPPVNTRTARSAVGKDILRCATQHAAGRAKAKYDTLL